MKRFMVLGCVFLLGVSSAFGRNVSERDRDNRALRHEFYHSPAQFWEEPAPVLNLTVREQTQFPGIQAIDGQDYLLSLRFDPEDRADTAASFGVKVYLVRSLQDEHPAYVALEFRGNSDGRSFDGDLTIRYRTRGAESSTDGVPLRADHLWIQVLRSGAELVFLVSADGDSAEDLQTLGTVYLGEKDYAKCQHVPFILSAPGVRYSDTEVEFTSEAGQEQGQANESKPR